jgi:hypothetical protein
MDILFTRAQISPLDSDATKDAQCVAELGPGYRAASLLDVHALWRSIFIGSPSFNSAGQSSSYRTNYNSSVSSFQFQGQQIAPLACARLY